MANPNLVLRNLPKRPYFYVKEFSEYDEAQALADKLKADGKEVLVKTIRNRFQKRRTFRVMQRDKKKVTQ